MRSKHQPYRIGIDARLSGLEHAGIGRYTSQLIQNITQLKTNVDVHWVLFFYSQQQANEVLKPIPQKIRTNITTKVISIRHYSLLEQIIFPFHIYVAKLDLFHVPHFNVPLLYFKKKVITIHDLLWHSQRGAAVTTLSAIEYWLKYYFYRLITRYAVTTAQTIFVPAETIKKEVSRHYPATKNKIVVTKEGVFPTEKTLQTRKTNKLKKTKDVQLLYVGSLYPHKNIEVVLAALQKQPKWQLTIAGARSVFQQKVNSKVQQLGIETQVTFLGKVSDQKLVELYQQSTALLQPSLSEGFGLTGLEAMAYGCPVIASDIPIFKEIYGEAALFFDPHSSSELIESIKRIQNRSKMMSSLIEKGIKNARGFSWKKMAERTFSYYPSI